jgi:PAS domain S-box-containing protein
MTLNIVLPKESDVSFFHDIFERNGAVQLLINPADGSIVDANPAACEFYGYPRDVFRTLTIFQINTLPEKEVRILMELVVKGERLNFDFYHRCAGGDIRDVVVNSGTVHIHGRELLLSIIHDITGIKRAELAKRQSHEQFLLVLNSMDALVYVADLHTNEILFANQYLHDSFPGDVIGRKCWEVLHGNDRGHCRFCSNERLIDENGMLRGVSRWEYRSERNNLWYQFLDRAILWIDGRVARISIGIDMTDRKKLEQEIITISEKERISIGHDLHDGVGQYFTGIGYLTRILKDKLERLDLLEKETAGEILSLIEEAKVNTRMLAKGLSPVTMDNKGLIMAIKELCMDTEKIFGSQCSFVYDHNIAIEDNFTATHLYYIIREAVNNAMRHGHARRVEVLVKESDDGIMFSVQDDGTGIDTENSSRGRGLGLNLMKYRADVIGGVLNISKNRNGGTTVTCTLGENSGRNRKGDNEQKRD